MKLKEKIKHPTPKELREMMRALVTFTAREKRGILYLLPMLILLSVLVTAVNRPAFERSFQLYADLVLDSLKDGNFGGYSIRPAGTSRFAGEGRTPDAGASQGELFAFDPNTVTHEELCRLGFTPRQATGILNYRSKGKVFYAPEDFADCYTVSDKMYLRLRPHILIGSTPGKTNPERTPAPGTSGYPVAAFVSEATHSQEETTRDSLFVFDPNSLTADGFRSLGFSRRQAEAIVRYREMVGGFRSAEEFSDCYPVTDRFDELKPYIHMAAPAKPEPVIVELNTADSVTLTAIRGIGPLTAGRIVIYRKLLGGFVRTEQLQEIPGMTERNYEMILQQIRVDSSKIQKIDINFADPKQLEEHPYLTPSARRKILKQRQLKGGWRTLTEMTEDKTLSTAEAEKLSGYLRFTPLNPKK